MDHGFDHGDGSWEDAGIMTTSRGEGGLLLVIGHCFLFAQDSGGGLEGHAEDDVFAIADAALDAAREVGRGADLAGT